MNVNEILSSNISEIKSNYVTPSGKNTSTSSDVNFDSYLNKTYSYNEIIDIASKTYNVPANLIKAVIFNESGFQTLGASYNGATGLMQLMPCACQTLGVSDATDPVQNIMGGTKLLSTFLDAYNGDIGKTLSAYAAGPAWVNKYNGVPPFCQVYLNRIATFMKEGVNVPDTYVSVNITGDENDLLSAQQNAPSRDIQSIVNNFYNSYYAPESQAGKTASINAAASKGIFYYPGSPYGDTPPVMSKNNDVQTDNISQALDKNEANEIKQSQVETPVVNESQVVNETDTVSANNDVKNDSVATINFPNISKDEPEYVTPDSYLTSSLKLQMLEAFKNYSNYMRVLDLISSTNEILTSDDEKN